MYSPNFEKAFREVLELEGVFSNDPKDRGGKTKYGITESTWNRYAKEQIIAKHVEEITPAEAKAVYWAYYWNALDLDNFSSSLITTELFEAAVNCGLSRGVKMLQEAANYCRPTGAERLKVDGVLGPVTRGTVKKLLAFGYRVPLFKAMNGEQYIWYKKLGDQHHARGWTRRLPGGNP